LYLKIRLLMLVTKKKRVTSACMNMALASHIACSFANVVAAAHSLYAHGLIIGIGWTGLPVIPRGKLRVLATPLLERHGMAWLSSSTHHEVSVTAAAASIQIPTGSPSLTLAASLPWMPPGRFCAASSASAP
jgi:hypothetical protein